VATGARAAHPFTHYPASPDVAANKQVSLRSEPGVTAEATDLAAFGGYVYFRETKPDAWTATLSEATARRSSRSGYELGFADGAGATTSGRKCGVGGCGGGGTDADDEPPSTSSAAAREAPSGDGAAGGGGAGGGGNALPSERSSSSEQHAREAAAAASAAAASAAAAAWKPATARSMSEPHVSEEATAELSHTQELSHPQLSRPPHVLERQRRPSADNLARWSVGRERAQQIGDAANRSRRQRRKDSPCWHAEDDPSTRETGRQRERAGASGFLRTCPTTCRESATPLWTTQDSGCAPVSR